MSKRYSSVIEYVEDVAGPEFAKELRDQIEAKRKREDSILNLLANLRGKPLSPELRNEAWIALVTTYSNDSLEDCEESIVKLLRIAAGKELEA